MARSVTPLVWEIYVICMEQHLNDKGDLVEDIIQIVERYNTEYGVPSSECVDAVRVAESQLVDLGWESC